MKTGTFYIAILVVVLLGPLLAACGRGPSAARRPVNVRVFLSEYKIESSLTRFKVGVPYHFVVTNKGSVKHEIMLMKPMETPQHMDMEELDKMALAHVEAEDLPPGAVATFDYTFTEPAASGELEFACHLPDHYEKGMRLPIIVVTK